MLNIRRVAAGDEDAIWAILEPVIREGETYDFGTYVLHPNRKGRGSHVANCGYMTARHAYGRGIGSAMCAHSMEEAKSAGYRAMQFNFVIANNHRAVALWTRMGFAIVGRIPQAYFHPTAGYTDAFVMHRHLEST